MKKTLVGALVALTVAGLMPAQAARRAPTVADMWKARIVREAKAQGINARTVLKSVSNMVITQKDGTVVTRKVTVAQALKLIGGGAAAPTSRSTAQPGPGGTPEINVGDLAHVALTISFGAPPPAIYSVTTSAIVPATPRVATAAPVFYEYGGPLTQIKGSGWATGFHSVGTTVVGSNADTGASGPYLPVLNAGVVPDSSIDFTGHVERVVNFKFCIFRFCLAAGAFVGDGVTLFDNTTTVRMPLIP